MQICSLTKIKAWTLNKGKNVPCISCHLHGKWVVIYPSLDYEIADIYQFSSI